MSNVKAVQEAQAAQKAAEQRAKKDIADYKKIADNKIADAVKDKHSAIRQANKKIKIADKNMQISQGSFVVTLLCCLIVHPVFLSDIWDFVFMPAVWVWNGIDNPVSAVLSLAFFAGIGYGILKLWLYYKKRWCSLSQRVLWASLAAVIIFGEEFQKYLNINLVLLFVVVQIMYLGVLIYLDGYFESKNMIDKWSNIQGKLILRGDL